MRLVDINVASIEALCLLRGIGKTTAQRIIENRPYVEPYDLVSRGVLGESQYQKSAALLVVTVASTSPVRSSR